MVNAVPSCVRYVKTSSSIVFIHKQYFIKAIRQNPKTDYIKPSRRKKYLQQKKRENKNIQIKYTVHSK